MTDDYEAILIVGFGGPEGPDDVMPFLENVTRGRGVPRERLLEVSEHYQHFGGVSPINKQVRELKAALREELDRHGVDLPIYWGNRNWTPFLPEAVEQMKADGMKKALSLVLAGYSSYSSCRQYREDVQRACEEVGEGAPEFGKIRVFYNHPEWVASNAECIRNAFDGLSTDNWNDVRVVFTAHSIPMSMANNCDYEKQLTEASRLIAEELGLGQDGWDLVYQSRSGRPQDPWLEPDILDHMKAIHENDGVRSIIIHPVGFLSDHMEVMFDLDEEAAELAEELHMEFARSASVGIHPRFVGMLRELIQERLSEDVPKRAVGQFGPNHDVCPLNCCPAPVRPKRPAAAER